MPEDITPRRTLLDHLGRIAELAKKHGLGAKLTEEAQYRFTAVKKVLAITPVQAALFSLLLENCGDDEVSIGDLAKTIKCGRIQLFKYMDDFDVLESKHLIHAANGHGDGIFGGRRRNWNTKLPEYTIPIDVIKALREGRAYTPQPSEKLTPETFWDAVDEILSSLDDDDIDVRKAARELKDMFDANKELAVVRSFANYDFGEGSVLVLLIFCNATVQNGRERYSTDMLRRFLGSYETKKTDRRFKSGEHKLIRFGLVEPDCDNGMTDTINYRLTRKAKQEFLVDVDLREKTRQRGKNIIRVETLKEKRLFYPRKISRRIDELTSLLREENLAGIKKRLADKNMRTGFACLFSGPPGTGKTETAYQIARETGRDIMLVDISEMRDKYVGESEKNIKEVFDRYHGLVKGSSLAPILLFNEADGVLGKRMEIRGGGNASVEKMDNAMQNIILQEMENLDGILIATTNMTVNLDKAFERRFLYKIEFEKPDLDAKKAIWQSIIPEMGVENAEALSRRFDFSGGQIENVARKQEVSSILSGTPLSFDSLKTLCEEENTDKDAKRIGFVRE